MPRESKTMAAVAEELLSKLACPRDKQPLRQTGDYLICAQQHRYRIVEGVPILLVSEASQTHIEGTRALKTAETGDTTQLAIDEALSVDIDSYVSAIIGATNGGLYQHLVGNLKEYPIPQLRLPPGNGKSFLEIGSNWGRWCIAAARLGYRPIGLDPSLRSVCAARRVAQRLGVEAHFIVGDGRYLPFADNSIDQVFSYSVLQHLSKQDTSIALREIRRVLAPGGGSLVQMPNVFGLRCLYHQIRMGFREPRDFDVRYWTIPELRRAFVQGIGSADISVDGFFSLNAQFSDAHLMPAKFRALLQASEALRRASERIPALAYSADSLYIASRKAPSSSE